MYTPTPETIAFIEKHLHEDVRDLALKLRKYPDVDGVFVLQQVAGKRALSEKVPSWSENSAIQYPKQLSLEQCSSEATALYKSTLVSGQSLVDLTGGLGVDTAFLARRFQAVTYVERNEELCALAANNFPALGLSHITVINSISEDFLEKLETVDCIFVDPARRDQKGGKIVAVADCEPNVAELAPSLLAKSKKLVVKLSPMLDLSQALIELPQTTEVHIISVNNECKELLLILENRKVTTITVHCVNIAKSGLQHFQFIREEEPMESVTLATQVGTYLYEPNASILKAGAFKSIASRLGLNKLHVNSHLYTSNQLMSDFPGRIFSCEGYFSMNKQELKDHLGAIKKANITVRNFPLNVADLRKRLKLQEGGDLYLFATTLADERKVLIKCRKI